MRLGEIYSFFVAQGIATDMRTRGEIRKKLSETKREFRKLNKLEKSLFDEDNFTNPYSDIRILNGDRKTQVKRILVGIDIEVGEMLLADRLSEKGKTIDPFWPIIRKAKP